MIMIRWLYYFATNRQLYGMRNRNVWSLLFCASFVALITFAATTDVIITPLPHGPLVAGEWVGGWARIITATVDRGRFGSRNPWRSASVRWPADNEITQWLDVNNTQYSRRGTTITPTVVVVIVIVGTENRDNTRWPGADDSRSTGRVRRKVRRLLLLWRYDIAIIIQSICATLLAFLNGKK